MVAGQLLLGTPQDTFTFPLTVVDAAAVGVIGALGKPSAIPDIVAGLPAPDALTAVKLNVYVVPAVRFDTEMDLDPSQVDENDVTV